MAHTLATHRIISANALLEADSGSGMGCWGEWGGWRVGTMGDGEDGGFGGCVARPFPILPKPASQCSWGGYRIFLVTSPKGQVAVIHHPHLQGRRSWSEGPSPTWSPQAKALPLHPIPHYFILFRTPGSWDLSLPFGQEAEGSGGRIRASCAFLDQV